MADDLGDRPTRFLMDQPFLDLEGDPDRLSLFVECLRLTHGYQFNPAIAMATTRMRISVGGVLGAVEADG